MRLVDIDKSIESVKNLIRNGATIEQALDAQPTAYDPEEVVELLEGASYFSEYLDAKTRYINLYKAIKIVREGGVK